MLRFYFTSQDYLRDPAEQLARLRGAGPVVKVRFPIIGKTWITTTNELAGRVLKDSETFTMRRHGKVAGLRWWMPGWIRTLAVSMLTMDEPDHTRLRSIVDEAFRRRAVIDMEPRIFAMADELVADLFSDGNPADLVERYARRLPLSVICELLGLPRDDRRRFIAWANSLTRIAGPLSFIRMLRPINSDPGAGMAGQQVERHLAAILAGDFAGYSCCGSTSCSLVAMRAFRQRCFARSMSPKLRP